jgi:two-component system CheB/CheR fusion protein
MPPPAEPRPMRRRRILVIEDNVDSAESLMYALALSGHDVQVAHDGRSGLELAKSFRPEIVICDIGLPGMDGYAVAKAFRAEKALEHVYLIALSGYAQPEDLQRALRAGFNEHVAKPTRLEKLDRLLADAPDVEFDDAATPPPERLH